MNKNIKSITVGGIFDDNNGLSLCFPAFIAKSLGSDLINGWHSAHLHFTSLAMSEYDLVVWMPKEDGLNLTHPSKKTGSVHVCMKEMKKGDTHIDAVSKIFDMHANAVIAIESSETDSSCCLIDALGNIWYDGDDVDDLCDAIWNLCHWTRDSIRLRSESVSNCLSVNKSVVDDFLSVCRDVSNRIADSYVGRYFGSVSTRCQALFPSCRAKGNESFLVSARDVDKRCIFTDDMVIVKRNGNKIAYEGRQKPSVDSPIHCELYEKLDWANFIIHGHNYVKGWETTKHYRPCGDLREVDEILGLEMKYWFTGVNLRNHGFVAISDSVENMKHGLDNVEFVLHQGLITKDVL